MRTFECYLQESWFKTTKEVEVFKNPDSSEMQQCKDMYLTVRGMLVGDDLYIWSPPIGPNGYVLDKEIHHTFMVRVLNLRNKEYIPIVFDLRKNVVALSSWSYPNKSEGFRDSLLKIIANHRGTAGYKVLEIDAR